MAGRSDRTLREIVRIIASRFWAMLAIIVVVVVCVGVITTMSPKWYRSEAQLQVSATDITNPLESQIYWGQKIEIHIKNMRALLFSDYVLASAMLQVEGEQVPATFDAQWTKKVNQFIADNPKVMKQLKNRVSVLTEGGPDSSFTQNLDIRVEWPEEPKVALEHDKDSRELAAERAHKFASAIISVYQKRRQQIDEKTTTGAAGYYQGRLAEAKTELDKAARQYNTFVESIAGNDIVDMKHMGLKAGAFDSGTVSVAAKVKLSLVGLNEQAARVESLKMAVTSQLNKPLDEMVVPDEIIRANPQIASLQALIQVYQVKINELLAKYTEGYNEVLTVKEGLKKAEDMLRKEIQRQVIRLDQEYQTYSARIVALKAQLNDDDTRMKKLAGKAATWQLLESELDEAREYHSQQMQEYNKAKNAQALANDQSNILLTAIDEPTTPHSDLPLKPVLWINLLFALVTGIVLSLVYAFMADHFDHSLKSIDDAERYLGVPVLASVPKLGGGIIRKQAGGNIE